MTWRAEGELMRAVGGGYSLPDPFAVTSRAG